MSDSSNNRTTAERITLAVSALILIGIIGLAAWSSYRVGDDVAVISIEAHLENVREHEGMFYLPVTISNTGGQTAQEVSVSAELETEGGDTETAEVTIAFLAGGEHESAQLIFSTDPSEGELKLRPASYVHP